jgi:hypothetical protein
VDVFLYGLTTEQAEAKIVQIYSYLKLGKSNNSFTLVDVSLISLLGPASRRAYLRQLLPLVSVVCCHLVMQWVQASAIRCWC